MSGMYYLTGIKTLCLSQTGFHLHTVSWLYSYLSDRQHVLVSGEHSQSACVLFGVPQRSVLGPLLFLLVIIKLCLSPNTRLTLYADYIYSSDTFYVQLQQAINLLSQWSDVNMLSFNTSKCKHTHAADKQAKYLSSSHHAKQ